MSEVKVTLVKGPKAMITKPKPVKEEPIASPPASKATISRRIGLQGILSLGFVAASVGLGAYRHSSDLQDRVLDFIQGGTPTEDSPPALMFVLDGDRGMTTPQGQAASSMIIRKWCDKAGVEYRRYQHNADLFQEEKWVRDCQSVGREFGSPCIVIVDRDGSGRAMTIPSGVEATIRLLEGIFNV